MMILIVLSSCIFVRLYSHPCVSILADAWINNLHWEIDIIENQFVVVQSLVLDITISFTVYNK